MNNIVIATVLFLIGLSASSGRVTGAEIYGGAGVDWGLGVAVSPTDRSYWLTGTFEESFSVDSRRFVSNGDDDVFLFNVSSIGHPVTPIEDCPHGEPCPEPVPIPVPEERPESN